MKLDELTSTFFYNHLMVKDGFLCLYVPSPSPAVVEAVSVAPEGTQLIAYSLSTEGMRSENPLRENPLVLSHHSRGLMFSRPRGITLETAAIRPSSL